jgi:DNA anti-recombination protein RmuC
VGQRLDIDVPAELIEAVQKRGLQIADWKSLYEQAAAGQQSAIEMYERATEMHDSQIADWKRLYDQANEALQAARDQQIEILEEKTRLIAALEERVASSAEEKPLSTKERETLLKIIIGMARDSYKYDPKLNRSSVPQEIADDLAKHSIFLDVDTVRKWLKHAAEFLPGD